MGLAIMPQIFRNRGTVNIDQLAMMLFLLRRKLGLLPKREFHSLAKLGPVASKSA